MDNKYRKIYNKLLDYREKGDITKALDLCETALAEDLRSSEILNFKGFMLYEKGMLKEAITVWKLNADLNNDSMALNYIKDAKFDEERLKIYKQAEQMLKKSDVNRAIELFEECEKSDFNCIKVNTGLAWCYQKKGDYYRAKEYIDKALKIDKDAVTANEIKKQLEDIDIYYGEHKNIKSKIAVIFGLLIIIAVSYGGYSFWKNSNNGKHTSDYVAENTEPSVSEADENKLENETEVPKTEEDSLDDADKKIDKTLLKSAIDSSDYNSIYDNIHNVNTQNLDSEEKELYDKALSILKSEGVSNFYEYGLWYFNQKDYSNAEAELSKAYDYCEGNNLEQHIIFYSGSTASEQGKKDLALEMYKKYNDLYPKGPYIEGVLYELALLTFDNDAGKAKGYAEKLINNYPQSIYINDKIMNIINK